VSYTVWHCPLSYKACPTSLCTSCKGIVAYIVFLLEQQFPPPLPAIQHKYYDLFAMYTNFILLYCLSCFYYHSNVYWSRDSSVGMAVESRWGARFSAPVQTGSEVHPASYTIGTGSFPGVKRSGRGVDHPLPSTVEVNERVELYVYSTLAPRLRKE